MGIFLASLLFLAASGTPSKPAVEVPDKEVILYLNSGEAAEWGGAMRQKEAGESRMQQGTSIMNATRLPSTGSTQETPEQVKTRAQKIINEGKAQVDRAMPSIERLRKLATARFIELTKTVDYDQPLLQTPWDLSLIQAAVRLQKVARDQGYKTQHLLGSMTILGPEKVYRTPVIAKALREAWLKADATSLAPIPSGGYTYKRTVENPLAQLSADWAVPQAAGQTLLIWAEVYPLTSDDAAGLLVVRMADAFTMRLVGSEIYLTTMGPSDALPKKFNAAIVLKDEKSFIPRLAARGDWLLSYDRDSHPLGVALLRHLCVRVGNLAVGASSSVYDLLGGDAPSDDGANASWKVLPQPAAGLTKSFKVSSKTPEGQTATVGELTLRLENVTPAAKPVRK